MKKCDVIIPVYKSAEWVKLCIYSLFVNTNNKILGKVILINDCDDKYTLNCLNNLKEKYKNKIEIIKNDKNLGFIKSTNKGLSKVTNEYALLLNTDCIITKNTIEKLLSHCENNEKIGMICPISSNAANLTLEMFEGFNYNQMNNLLEQKFNGKNFNACTVVGNCLLLKKKCIDKIGLLDESFGLGYGEETDYQFRALQHKFEAKVAIDTYVFHKSEVSFGTSKEKQERLKNNRNLFFSRWKNEYQSVLEKYEKNDPIKYIKEHLTEEDYIPKIETAFYLNGIVQNAGGVHVVVDLINYLAINNLDVNIVYDMMSSYEEIMLFNPISSNRIENIKIKQIVSTIYQTAFSAKKIADKKNIKLISFIQGYEGYFENGAVYGIVETSYKLADSILTISKYLQNELKEVFKKESYLIPNSVNLDLLLHKNNSKCVKVITMIMRNNIMKGDWILIDLIKKISNKFKNLEINVIYSNKYIEFPSINNDTIKLNKILGPLPREKIYKILQSSDVYIDASLTEGFGLMGLEALASGVVPIVSNSKGIVEYIQNNENGLIIEEANNADSYIKKLKSLIENPKEYERLKNNIDKTINKYDIDDRIKLYKDYLLDKEKFTNKKEILTDKDMIIINASEKKQIQIIAKKRKFYYIAKIIPKRIKNKIKKIITFLYNMYSH